MSNDANIHVTPRDDGWAVKREPVKKPLDQSSPQQPPFWQPCQGPVKGLGRPPSRRVAKSSDTVALIRQMARAPLSTGTFTPSSRALAEALIASAVPPTPLTFVVELGVGTGSMTRALLSRGLPDTKYLGIELNSDLHTRLRSLFPRLSLHRGNAEDLRSILSERALPDASHVIASLPWTLMNSKARQSILTNVASVIQPGGLFVTFMYLTSYLLPPQAIHFHSTLRTNFRSINLSMLVWRNFPPALVWTCSK
jgi:phospholipid N-methyltransferase